MKKLILSICLAITLNAQPTFAGFSHTPSADVSGSAAVIAPVKNLGRYNIICPGDSGSVELNVDYLRAGFQDDVIGLHHQEYLGADVKYQALVGAMNSQMVPMSIILEQCGGETHGTDADL